MKSKLHWQVIGGEDINIWTDDWIEGETLEVDVAVVHNLPQKVADLINEDRNEWVWSLFNLLLLSNKRQPSKRYL